ncbi:MAG: hypothetical protein SPI92_00755 [Alloprevotella sp.]|nr:hypothetical protein [Alloprevotella sp.]
MTSFLAKRDREFVEEGGIRERMTAARLEMRATQKQTIEQQDKEIARLKGMIAAQQREIEALRARLAMAERRESPGEPGKAPAHR